MYLCLLPLHCICFSPACWQAVSYAATCGYIDVDVLCQCAGATQLARWSAESREDSLNIANVMSLFELFIWAEKGMGKLQWNVKCAWVTSQLLPVRCPLKKSAKRNRLYELYWLYVPQLDFMFCNQTNRINKELRRGYCISYRLWVLEYASSLS